MQKPKTAIVGGGAAGFFAAINLKELVPEMDITIFEASQRVLAKVEISGGGRCNCTNSFEGVTCGGISLQAVSATTLESKSRPRLFFAGEVLDIDGITGGFNFQAAWTTAFVVARAISEKHRVCIQRSN